MFFIIEEEMVHDHVINDEDEADGNEDYHDWMGGTIVNHVDEQDFDDTSKVQTLWDKNHDFSQSYQDCTNTKKAL